jgi:hypothetical protein
MGSTSNADPISGWRYPDRIETSDSPGVGPMASTISHTPNVQDSESATGIALDQTGSGSSFRDAERIMQKADGFGIEKEKPTIVMD